MASPPDGPEPRRRLAQLMDDRRIELDLAWEEVARRAGVAGLTLRRIRSGESALSRRTAAKIERALEWLPGSVEAILAGNGPTPIPEPAPPKPLTALQREALTELDQLMAAGVPDDDAIDQVVQHAREALERSRRTDQTRRDAG